MKTMLLTKNNRFTEVHVKDTPGSGGAYHEYTVCPVVNPDWPQDIFAKINFQKGPIGENGVNGIFIEDLLDICRHRLQCFQSGEFACRENALAMTKIEEALHWLNHRTADRQLRGVEGTSKK